MKILIVKTSSLGDIVQTFPVLNDLNARFPDARIDWVVEENISQVVASHPFIHKAIALPLKKLKSQIFSKKGIFLLSQMVKELRQDEYDLVFDLQGNCKSGVLTMLCRAKIKIGFDLRSVREWPNVLATHVRFPISKEKNIRMQYLGLLSQYFRDGGKGEGQGVRFNIGEDEKKGIQKTLDQEAMKAPLKIMVCPGSRWVNKQLPFYAMANLLSEIRNKYRSSFLLVWGNFEEKQYCEEIQKQLKDCSVLADPLTIAAWQYLMNEMNLVIAIDSSALHLAGTTSVPSFSIFGPTSSSIFKPMGNHHFAFQGKCPYGKVFHKQCPLLRTCETGACIRELSGKELFIAFGAWWEELSHQRL